MIKIFRRIRQELLSDHGSGNSTQSAGKYLKYALGEIILVVIGILIALQINNWNNLQKDKEAEIKYLHQIKNSLKDSDLILEKQIDRDKKILSYGKYLFKQFKNQEPLNDSIKKLLVSLQYDQMVTLNMAAFENLKNDGLSFISNDDLKFEIINIYDQDLKYIQQIFASQYENYISNVINPFFSKNFEIVMKDNYYMAIPNDYQDLLKHDEITNIISMINTMRSYAILIYGETREKIQEVVALVDKEINLLSE